MTSEEDLLHGVRRELESAGFEDPAHGMEGLHLSVENGVVLLGWQPADLLRPGTHVHGNEPDFGTGPELVGIRKALNTALAVVLTTAGYHVTARSDGRLRITHAPN
ncbi:hypothetical protein ACFYYB_40605 [Streptomyces sp. NPDC002886]|uniref:hypothetical protein n=1 Tax=Streptomyces sp. NPDC002886 TaxID=3364667 RepID=UPI00368BB5CD